MTDIIEDLLAFAYATKGRTSLPGSNSCPVCGAEMEENDEGEVCCPECAE